jgi:hypothetical protein
MKVPVKAYLFMEHEYTADYSAKEWRPALWKCEVGDAEDRIFIGERNVEIEIPDDFNPVQAQVAALEKQKLAALALYQQSVAEINERLSKLQAIEHQPSPVEA